MEHQCALGVKVLTAHLHMFACIYCHYYSQKHTIQFRHFVTNFWSSEVHKKSKVLCLVSGLWNFQVVKKPVAISHPSLEMSPIISPLSSLIHNQTQKVNSNLFFISPKCYVSDTAQVSETAARKYSKNNSISVFSANFPEIFQEKTA